MIQLLKAAVILLAGFWAFSPALHGGWLWDDDYYITANPLLGDPGRLWKIWLWPGCLNEYYPVTETVQFFQWHLFGMHTFGYHLTNVLLHLVNALLVWRLLHQLGLRFAWLGGLFFAVHPLTVLSVAWISELKNTLSLVPFLLSLSAFISYEENKNERSYRWAFGFFILAILCKVSAVTLPVILLLYLWWKRGNLTRRDLDNLSLFFLAALLFGILASLSSARFMQVNHFYSSVPPPDGLFCRLNTASLTVFVYIFKFLWPSTLLPVNRPWNQHSSPLFLCLLWSLFIGIFCSLWVQRQAWGRPLLLGLGFFLVNLAPLLGYILLKYSTLVWVLDHLTYVANIGLIGLVVLGLEQIHEALPLSIRTYAVTGLALIAAAVLACHSRAYAGKYTSQVVLWNFTLQHDPTSLPARMALAQAYLQNGQFPEAKEQYQAVLQLDPGNAEILCNLGIALAQMGRISEAIEQVEKAQEIQPGNTQIAKILEKLRAAR